jgi:hypothetical protein
VANDLPTEVYTQSKGLSNVASWWRRDGRDGRDGHHGCVCCEAWQPTTPRMRAFAAYKDFLTLWKDADPAIPILKEAKAEYAKLQ